ncbi:acetaldehyde dehydrogenase [Fibrobacteres bacterium R8-0-B4]
MCDGIANALMLSDVLRCNAVEVPPKMGTFPQYDHPKTLSRYAEVADALGLGGKAALHSCGLAIVF